MPLPPEKLQRLCRAGDLAGVVDFLAGRSAAERTALAPTALAAVRDARFVRAADGRGQAGGGGQWNEHAFHAARLAALGCAPWSKLERMNWNDHNSFSQAREWTDWWRQLLRLFEATRPPWLDAWVHTALRQNIAHWFFVRELMRRKLCARPAGDAYTLGLLEAMRWRFHTYVKKKGGGAESKFPTIAHALLDDPELLQEDIWRIFEIEGTSECNLQSLEPTQGTNWRTGEKIPAEMERCSWRYALVRLVRDDHLPRARVLDASLAAAGRDFAPHRAGWFLRLHDALEPTPQERTTRLASYLALLASAHPNVAAWALQVLVDLDQERPLPAPVILEHLGCALTAKSKSAVKIALQLLGRAVAREAKQRPALLRLAVPALLHETADVQTAVFKLLERHGDKTDAALAQAVQAHAASVVPSLRPRLAAWSPGASVKLPAAPAVSTPLSRRAPPPVRLAPEHRIAAIANFDELLDRAAFALANPAATDEVERVLDGLARFGAHRPTDFATRVAPLRHTMIVCAWPHLAKEKTLLPQDLLAKTHAPSLASVPELLTAVLESWCVGRDLFPRWKPSAMDDVGQVFRFLYQRLHALALRVLAGVELPLLSAPTHRRGWIEPAALATRLRAWQAAKRAVDPADFCLAVLRLAPEKRAAGLAEARTLKGETGDALRHALGAEDVCIGPTAEFWIAAARARAPFLDDPAVERAHPRRGPDAGTASRLAWLTERTIEHFKNPFERVIAEAIGVKPPTHHAFSLDTFSIAIRPSVPATLGRAPLPVLLHGGWDGDGFTYKQETELLRWGFTLWPASREPLFGALALWLMSATQSFTYREAYRHGFMQVAFDTFNDPHTRPGPMGTLLHAFALLSPEAQCRGLGVDALAALVDTGRFSAEALGVTLARLLPTTLCKLSRLTPALAETARISSAHAAAVRMTIEEMLAGDPARAPRDLGTLLELLVELHAEAGTSLTHASAHAYLARAPASGRAAKLVARLLGR